MKRRLTSVTLSPTCKPCLTHNLRLSDDCTTTNVFVSASHSFPFDDLEERFHHLRIEVSAGLLDDEFTCLFNRPTRSVRTI